jgi:hypothetical protein
MCGKPFTTASGAKHSAAIGSEVVTAWFNSRAAGDTLLKFGPIAQVFQEM